jgi:hypothetical protein
VTSLLRVKLREHLTAALRGRDRQSAGVIRSVLAALENAEAQPATSRETPVATSEHIAGVGAGEAPRRPLSADEERAVVEREVAELRSASATLAAAGRHERATELTHMAGTVEDILNG